MRAYYSSLFGMTYITWNGRQTNFSLFEKTLSLKSEKYLSAKYRVYEQILMMPEIKLSKEYL